MEILNISESQKSELVSKIKAAYNAKKALDFDLNALFSNHAKEWLKECALEKGQATALANYICSLILPNWYYKRNVLAFVEDTFESKANREKAIALAKKLELPCERVTFLDGSKKTVIFKHTERKRAKAFKEQFKGVDMFDGQSEPNGTNFVFTFALECYNAVKSKSNGGKRKDPKIEPKDEKGINALTQAISTVFNNVGDLSYDELLTIKNEMDTLLKSIKTEIKKGEKSQKGKNHKR